MFALIRFPSMIAAAGLPPAQASGPFFSLTQRHFASCSRYPRIEGGVLALAFLYDKSLAAISGQGQLTMFAIKNRELERTRASNLVGLVSGAAIDGEGGRIAVGCIPLARSICSTRSVKSSDLKLFGYIRTLSRRSPSEETRNDLVSASSNGTVAILDLAGRQGAATALPSFAPEPSVLRADAKGKLVAASSSTGRAGAADELGARPLRRPRWRPRPPGPDRRGAHEHRMARRSSALTSREREVLRLLAAGRSNREIASVLFIAPKTASVHVSNILGKLGAASRTEAAAIAHREGLTSQLSGR